MSKIGIKPVALPSTVTVTQTDGEIVIKGAKGEVRFAVPRSIAVHTENGVLTVKRHGEDGKTRALHGLVRSLIANAVTGVETPWTKTLEVHGVGFKAAMEAGKLVFKLGLSHPVVFELPTDVLAEVKGNKVILSGVNRQQVGEVGAKIKSLRKPDKYKGKGIRYAGEVIKLKPGKKAKAGA